MKRIIIILGILFAMNGIEAQEVSRGQLMQLFYSAQKCQKNGDNEGAIQSYNQIVKLVPELPEPYLALGFLYSAKDDDTSEKLALHAYRKYIELSPRNAQRDSISRIVFVLEQMANVSPGIGDFPDDEPDDSPAPVTPKISLPAQTPGTKALHKPFEGKWISNRFVQSTMIPQWVFDISFSGNDYTIRFHNASQRYSKYLDAKEKEPVRINDTCLFVSFARPEIYTPSESGYYVKSVISQVSNPLFVYSVMGQEKKMKSDELAKRQKSSKELLDKMRESEKDNKPEQRETIEELTITRLSEYALSAKCKEILKIQRYGEKPVVNEDVFETVFYKIPDDMPFVMLGRDNCQITNQLETDEQPYKQTKALIKEYRKQAKQSNTGTIKDKDLYDHLAGIDSLGYVAWYGKKETGNILKTVGKGLVSVASVVVSAVAVNQFPVVDNFGEMILQWLSESVYTKSVNSLSMFGDTIDNNLKVNPAEWNTKMYRSLLDHYGNNENMNIQTIY